ncbi:hypothetical protein ASE63_04790 [Bosea sp. Root381]|uniref:DUF3108 domain-containing protein n=1 Tax=Bosea sp. Root381 TaxID=1736524 RepID=UPI000700A2A7|nr:DUF3108 domain-containing protein [Bosea sp. Root381]KRE09838.1 hypothetical protein ASE63_04790 [Bosea sp. Root381]
MKPAIASSLAGFALAVATLGATNLSAASLDARYDVSLLGLTLGTASLNGGIDGSNYKLDVAAKLTGLVGGFTGGRGSGAATGSLNGTRLSPASFAVSSASSSESRTVRMALDSNSVSAVEIVPPIDAKPDRVPIKDDHRRNIVDPLSAFLMPVNGKGLASACNRTLQIFDGAARYDIRLSQTGTREVKLDGYSGPVAVCQVRYVPISGHRALRPSTKFMVENKDISTWLAPVAGTNLMVPVRVSVKTMIGTAVLEASSFKVDPGQTATNSRRE